MPNKRMNGVYTKKELLKFLKTLPDNKVIIMSNYFKSISMSPGSTTKSTLSMQTQFSNEIFARKGDISQFNGSEAFTMMAIDQNLLSEEWRKGLKDNDGVFGFILE
jgi:hypothetical protein